MYSVPLTQLTSQVTSTPFQTGVETHPLSLSARFHYVPSILGFGPAPDGTTDNGQTFNAASAAVGGAGGGVISVPAGSYVVHQHVTTAPNTTWLFTGGTSIDGADNFDAIPDSTVLAGNFGLQTARSLSGPSNEFVQVIQATLQPSNSPGSFEKAGLYVRVSQTDTSDYTKGITRDGVGIDSQVFINGGTKTGRVWAYDAIFGTDGSSDGFCVGIEMTGYNNSGTDSRVIDQHTSKYGLKMITSGSNDLTAAIIIESAWAGHTGMWNYGTYYRASAIRTYAWVLGTGGGDYTVSAYLDPIGNILGKTLKSSGGIGAFGATPPASKPAITGSRSAATASVLQQVLSALSAAGFITDNTTA